MTGNIGRSALLYKDLYDGEFDMKDYRNTASSSMAGLPDVKDPEATFAGITRQDYLDYIKNFRDFELNLLSMTEDDSLRPRQVEHEGGLHLPHNYAAKSIVVTLQVFFWTISFVKH